MPVQMTQRQYEQLVGDQALLETDLSLQVVGFLQARGWHPYRMARIVVPALQLFSGEPGVADYQFRYYLHPEAAAGAGLLLWIEFKRESDRRTCQCLKIARSKSGRRCTVCDQKNWREREEKYGGRVWQIRTFQEFATLYQKYYGWLHKPETAVRGQLALPNAK